MNHKSFSVSNWLVYLFFLFLSLFTIHGILRGQIIIFWDQFYPINTGEAFDAFGSFFNKSVYPGVIDSSGINLLPLILLIHIFSFGGQQILLSQYLIFGLTIFLALCSTFALTKLFVQHIFKQKYLSQNQVQLVGVIAAIFYLFNPYVADQVFRVLNTNFILFAVLPLCLFSLYKITFTRKWSWVTLFVVLHAFVLAPTFTNLAFLIVHAGILVIFGLLFIYLQENKLLVFAHLVLTACLVFLCSLWWLVPQIVGLTEKYSFAAQIGGLDVLEKSSEKTTFLDLIQLNSLIRSSAECKTWPTSCDADILKNSWLGLALVCFLYLIFILHLRTLFIHKLDFNKLKNIHFYFGLFVFWFVFAAIISGLNQQNPFKEFLINVYYNSSWLATAFRDSYHKMGNHFLLIYALLVAYSGGYFLNVASQLPKKYRIPLPAHIYKIATLCLTVLIILAAPLSLSRYYFNGQIIVEASEGRPGSRFQLTKNYKNLNQILSKINSQNVITLPLQRFLLNFNNTTPATVGYELVRNLTFKPTISTGSADSFYSAVNYLDKFGTPEQLISALEDLSVDTIVLPKNEAEFYEQQNILRPLGLPGWEHYTEKFKDQPRIDLIEENEDYLVYKLPQANPFFYTAKDAQTYRFSSDYKLEPYPTLSVNEEKVVQNAVPLDYDLANVGLSFENVRIENEQGRVKRMRVQPLEELDFGVSFFNFNRSMDYKTEELKTNFFYIRAKCEGCFVTISAEYFFEGREKDRQVIFASPVNPNFDSETGQTRTTQDYYTFIYDLYYPEGNLTNIFVQLVYNKQVADQESYLMEIDEMGFINKNDQAFLDESEELKEYCATAKMATEPNQEISINYTAIYLPIDVRKKPYLNLKIKNTEDSLVAFHFSGFNQGGDKNALFLPKASYKDPEISDKRGYRTPEYREIELDLRDVGFSEIDFFNLHVINEKAKEKTAQSCAQIIGTSLVSKSNDRAIDALTSSFNRKQENPDFQKEILPCEYEDKWLSPNFQLKCPGGGEALFTSLKFNKNWKIAQTKAQPEQAFATLQRFNLEETAQSKTNFLLEYESYKYVRLGYIFSTASFTLIFLYLLFNVWKSREQKTPLGPEINNQRLANYEPNSLYR